MSLIRVQCAHCGTALQVRGEMAGQQGRCPKCGATIAIPAAAPPASPSTVNLPAAIAAGPAAPSSILSCSPPGTGTARLAESASAASSPPSNLLLADATPQDMLAEMHRRKKSAVLVVFETPLDGSYAISRRPEADVRCSRTSDMTDGQLLEILAELGKMTPGASNPKGALGLQPEGQPLPYELKGDRLGMTLEEFKSKHSRRVGVVAMPYCADSSPGQANAMLWSEAWHVAAGLINARTDLPSENNPPTIAGVRTELFLYHFVDGKLYRMTVLFDTEAFHLIHNAVVQKYGPPTRENQQRGELAWDNGPSAIKLTRGSIRPKKASSLLVVHHQLQKSSEGRAPARSADL